MMAGRALSDTGGGRIRIFTIAGDEQEKKLQI